jgi:hypothetical protein
MRSWPRRVFKVLDEAGDPKFAAGVMVASLASILLLMLALAQR